MTHCRLTWLIVMLLCGVASIADADVALHAGFGYGRGTLQAGDALPVQSTPVILEVSREGAVQVSGVFQHHFMSYQQDGSKFDGIDVLAGGALGVKVFRGVKSDVRVRAGYYPSATMVMASDTSGTVNDETFRHSTLTTFKSSAAVEGSLIYVYELKEGQFNRRERLRYGASLNYLSQSLTARTIKIATSNADLVPRQIVKEAVNYKLTIFSLGLMVGYAF